MNVAPTKLNLGSGPEAVPGWVNIDRAPALLLDRLRPVKRGLLRVGLLTEAHLAEWSRDILAHDLRRPLPFGDESVDAIYSSHALEHLYMDDTCSLLRECHRVLRPGAVVRLALPDAAQLARELAADEDDPDVAMRFNERLHAHPMARPRSLARVTSILTASRHRWQPTAGLVTYMLAEAGFSATVRCNFREGELSGLKDIETRSDSFFIEARR